MLRSEQWQERARSAIGARAEVSVLQRLLDEGMYTHGALVYL